jgi:hypothetical protein
MTLEYGQAVEGKRRPWQRRIEVFSPKLRRRLTLFSRDAQDVWILLEADPHVHSSCERPAYMEGNEIPAIARRNCENRSIGALKR